MATPITGTGLGLFDSSLNLLGNLGPGGNATLGRGGERVYVNGTSGNLVIQAPDEYLASVGLDPALIRTYNSQGRLDDDNADNWRLNIAALAGLTGSVNTAGSSITKTFGDGAEVIYIYDTAQGLYVSPAGDGAHDTLSFNDVSRQWTWTEGSTRIRETYSEAGQLLSTQEPDGHLIGYTYSGSLLTQITDASGQVTYLDYSGNNLTQIRTQTPEGSETRVRYGYDALNRLTQVIVDLTPADNTALTTDLNNDGRQEGVNNESYVTTYTYEGTSKRLASITQGDGATISFGYVEVGGEWKLASYTDGAGRLIRLSYAGVDTVSFTADPAALIDTATQTGTVDHGLNSGTLPLSTPSGAWSGAALFETAATAASSPHIAFDASGNAQAVYLQGGMVYARRYVSGVWEAPVAIKTGTAAAAELQFVRNLTKPDTRSDDDGHLGAKRRKRFSYLSDCPSWFKGAPGFRSDSRALSSIRCAL